MKLTVLSDLHGYLPDNLPNCDVVCICGDISPLKIQSYTKNMKEWISGEFSNWIESLPCKNVIMIAGNHDWIFERHPELIEFINESQSKLHILEDFGIIIDGKHFYGTPWCPDLARWAFYEDHDGLVERFSLIPENVDVLLTHCPPKVEHYGTVLQNGVFNFMEDYGCYELTEAIFKKKPKYHFFGHIHSSDHTLKNIGGINLANVSLKDENYEVKYEPYVIEI